MLGMTECSILKMTRSSADLAVVGLCAVSVAGSPSLLCSVAVKLFAFHGQGTTVKA